MTSLSNHFYEPNYGSLDDYRNGLPDVENPQYHNTPKHEEQTTSTKEAIVDDFAYFSIETLKQTSPIVWGKGVEFFGGDEKAFISRLQQSEPEEMLVAEGQKKPTRLELWATREDGNDIITDLLMKDRKRLQNRIQILEEIYPALRAGGIDLFETEDAFKTRLEKPNSHPLARNQRPIDLGVDWIKKTFIEFEQASYGVLGDHLS